MSKVYSYLRFSDPKQATGSSIERQIAYAEKWAAERGLQLDTSLSLRDEGLSAYHQRHVKQGALGTFLSAITDGMVPPGSVLIVEGLDRLSRAEPILAQAQLAQIINAGITVVTASDAREYNRESLKAQPMDLVYSLLVMIRAHEESDTKAKRVKAAIRRQCEGWIAGTYRGFISNGHDPGWVQRVGDKYELIPDRAAAMRTAIQLYKDGHGGNAITNRLDEKGFELYKNRTKITQLYKIFKNPVLMGTKVLRLDGEEYHLKGYYPALISENEFAEFSVTNKQRARRKGKGEIPGIITGFRKLFCGYCGSAVVAQNLMNRSKPGEKIQNGHRRLICAGYADGCPQKTSASAFPVETALLDFCSDQFNLSALTTRTDQTASVHDLLTATKQSIQQAQKKLDVLTEAMMQDEGATLITFARKAREMESELANLREKEKQLNVQIWKTSDETQESTAAKWAGLRTGVLDIDYDARMQCRQLVDDTFERIVIWPRSMSPDDDDHAKNVIDLLLMSKTGVTRLLRIKRGSGQLISGADYNAQT